MAKEIYSVNKRSSGSESRGNRMSGVVETTECGRDTTRKEAGDHNNAEPKPSRIDSGLSPEKIVKLFQVRQQRSFS